MIFILVSKTYLEGVGCTTRFMELIMKAFILACFGLLQSSTGIPDVKSIQLCVDQRTFVEAIGDSGVVWFDEVNVGNVYRSPCILKIESCSSCRLNVSLIDFDGNSFICSPQDFKDKGCISQCNYLYIFDEYYKNQTITYYQFKTKFTSTFISESSSIFIGLCHISTTVNLTLRYAAIKKTIMIQSSSASVNSTGYVTSPSFPAGYAQNYENYEFEFISLNQDDYIQLTFDDWDLSPKTELAFENSEVVGPVYGANYRPVVVSYKSNLKMVFNTGPPTSTGNEKNFMGFKATYRFVGNRNLISKPETACGHYTLNTQGGVLEFKPPVPDDKYYDCVWVVKKQPGYDAIQIKLIEFSSRLVNISGKRNKVEIYSGLTSMGQKLKEITASTLFFESDDIGFYVRLTGKFQAQDKLVLTYASYIRTSLGQQCMQQMYMCSNYRCIHEDLRCDGYDNCGDTSDELEECGTTWSKSYQYTITIGVIVPVVISAFLIVVICLLIIMIRKCRQSRASACQNQSSIPTVSGNASRRRRGRRRRGRERDSPPTYDEAIQSPPSWYCNLTFNISSSDPALPSPPSYSEAVGEIVQLVNTPVTPGSPTSTNSSQSEGCHRPVYDTSSSSSNSSRATTGVVDSHRPVTCRRSFSYSSVDSEFDMVPNSANWENNPTVINERSSAVSRRPICTPRSTGQRSESQQKNRANDWKGVEVIDENLCVKNRAQKVKRKRKKRGQQREKFEERRDLDDSTTPKQRDSGPQMHHENINAQHDSRPQSSSRIENQIVNSVGCIPDQSSTSIHRQKFAVTRPMEATSHSRSRSRSPLRENPIVTTHSPSHKKPRNNSQPFNQENKMKTTGRSPGQDISIEDNLADQNSYYGSRDTLIPCGNDGNQGNQSTTSSISAGTHTNSGNWSRSSSNSDTCSPPPNQRKKSRKKKIHGPVSSSAQQTQSSAADTEVAIQRSADSTEIIMGSGREELSEVPNRPGFTTASPPTSPALYFMTLYREGGEDEDVFV